MAAPAKAYGAGYLALQGLIGHIDRIPGQQEYGRVAEILGMLVEVAGVPPSLSIGDRCDILAKSRNPVPCEVVGFRAGRALAMPFHALEGIGLGSKTIIGPPQTVVHPSREWLGRVVNGVGEPIDDKGPLPLGGTPYPLRAAPPPAHQRQRVGAPIDLGVRAINNFVTCCRGQRMGIFSASGVGKSVLMSMMARFTASDVNVIGLIGERGREVQEFIAENLGPEGLARSIVVVATSDQSPLMRRQAALLTLSISEYFRDLGEDVLCMIDSVTRFAQAQREIGLSAGEPPTTKGYTPTVFSELPKLLERAGPGVEAGSITGLFTVLVEGDDHDEPVADAVRAILDGHIVLDRSIAERGRYPSVNILRSTSRTMPACNTPEQAKIIADLRAVIATYEDMEEMIRLGAYRPGTDPKVDRAIATYPAIEAFLAQDKAERGDLAAGFDALAAILASAPATDLESIRVYQNPQVGDDT